MEPLHETARTFVAWLLETSVQVAVLVAAILAAQFLLRRWLTPRWRYGLWLLVPVRLVMPALPPSPVSVLIRASCTILTTCWPGVTDLVTA